MDLSTIREISFITGCILNKKEYSSIYDVENGRSYLMSYSTSSSVQETRCPRVFGHLFLCFHILEHLRTSPAPVGTTMAQVQEKKKRKRM